MSISGMPSSALEMSAYSKTTTATIPSYQSHILLPVQALDSTSAIVHWTPYPNITYHRLKITNFPLAFETACDEFLIKDTSLVPNLYRQQGKLLTTGRDSTQGKLFTILHDTVRGLTPNTLYRFQLMIDTIQQSLAGIPLGYLSEGSDLSGFIAEERSYLTRRRKFLPLGTYKSLPISKSISYYEAPLVNDSNRYFTIADSNTSKPNTNSIIDFSTPRIPYERILFRLESMKNSGIPIDTAYIAIEGMLGAYHGLEELPSGGPRCYFARVTCVFTLRHSDTRVTQFARPGNGWLSFSWDTDYRRFVFPTATSVHDENTTFVSGTPTLQSNPNPFTDEATITYTLPSEANVKVEVFSILGQRMTVFPIERHAAGTYTIPIQAAQWASGTYLVRLTLSDTQGSIRTINHKISLLH